jgi:hypothetical protein
VDYVGRNRECPSPSSPPPPPPTPTPTPTPTRPRSRRPTVPQPPKKQIGVAVGALAILDQRLRTIPFVYDGPNPAYKGQTARIEYCLLSSSSATLASAQPQRCQLATAAPAASLGLSLLWVLVRGIARERAPGASPVNSIVASRVAESAISALGACWWLATGVVVSLWTSQANAVEAPSPLPGSDWRNTMSFLYWLNFLLFVVLMVTSVLLVYLTKMRQSGRIPPGGNWRATKGAAPQQAVHAAAPAPVRAPAAAPPAPVAMAPPPGGHAAPAPLSTGGGAPAAPHTAVNVGGVAAVPPAPAH